MDDYFLMYQVLREGLYKMNYCKEVRGFYPLHDI
jgi:hypothetical protein